MRCSKELRYGWDDFSHITTTVLLDWMIEERETVFLDNPGIQHAAPQSNQLINQ